MIKLSKKIGLALAILTIVNIGTISSQVRFGIRGGVDVIDNDISTKMLKVENRMGYQLGGSLDFTIPIIGLGIESGLLFGQKDYKSEQVSEGGAKISNYNYLSVPLYLKQRVSLFGLVGIYFTGGVYGNFRVSGGDVKYGDEKYSPENFQKGLSAGAGVSLLNHLELGMNYRHRLGDSYSSDIDSHFNKVGRNTWTVTLACYL